MRTDCEVQGKKHRCYRGLEYTILKEKKSSKYVGQVEVKEMIKDKESELNKLHSEIRDLERLNQISEKVEILREADKKEVEFEYLKNHVSKEYNLTAKSSAFSFLISGMGVPLKDEKLPNSKNVFLPALGGEFNQILWKNISFRLQLSFLTSLDDEEKIKKTHNKVMYHSYGGTDINFGLPIQFDFGYLTPYFGVSTVKYKSTINNIDQWGGVTKQENDLNYNSTYYGLSGRVGKKFFLDIGPRYYVQDKKLSGSVSVGINFGY